MSTQTQEAAKLEQLSHESPDEIEIAAGREREQLEGWVPALASEKDVREVLEKAFDYRGDVTITLKNGETVVGYVFDRRPGKSLVDSYVRVLPQESRERRDIPYASIAALSFTGRDTAAGKSWEACVKK